MLQKNRTCKLLCILLSAVLFCSVWIGQTSLAAGTPTSVGFTEHAIKAYRDGWKYQSGGKGQVVGGSRVSDCAGLLYAYFSDLGVGGCMGGATSQVNYNCVFSGDIADGVPRIHGLALTCPDYYDPGSGIYGHIGIYVGNGEVVDNSDYGVNMRWQKLENDSTWTAWHLFSNGMQYPSNGWYVVDGKMYHYTDYQYDVDTVVDGYTLGGDGAAVGDDGKPAPVDNTLKNQGWVDASTVADHLKSLGYSGKDSTWDLIHGSGGTVITDPDYNGVISGSEVNLRAKATTKSGVLAVFSNGTRVIVLEKTTGERVTYGSRSSDSWYKVGTVSGKTGYVSTLFVTLTDGAPKAPRITCDNGYVSMTNVDGGDAEIYYTTDCSVPQTSSTPYTEPVYLTGYTFRAIAVRNGQKSEVSTATVLSDGSLFTDFTTENWYFDAVDSAVYYGIFRGNGNGSFSPSSNITRAQFVQVLANFDGVDLSKYDRSPGFTDVAAGSTYEKAISWAVENGVVKGYSNNTFQPNQSITREQMCLILANYAGLTSNSTSTPFADDGSISKWAKEAVYACRDNGLINGMGENIFSPKGTATRAQAAVIMVKYYEK